MGVSIGDSSTLYKRCKICEEYKHKMSFPSLGRTIKAFILERDDHTCHYCRKYGNTIDHKLPKSKGGLSTIANCVCACSKCNTK